MAVTSALLLSLFRELLGLHLLFEFADVLELYEFKKLCIGHGANNLPCQTCDE